MLTTPHMLVGGAIGKRVKWPYVALPLAFVSHFVLDRIPHVDAISVWGLGDLRSNLGIAADIVVGVALLLALTRRQKRKPWILLGAVAAVFADIIALVTLWFRETADWPVIYHSQRLHTASAGDVPASEWMYGLATQVLVVALAIVILLPRTKST